MRIFREGIPATFSCKCFIVRHLATQVAPWHFKESCPHTTKIWEVPVDTWWLAWWKPSTCLFFQWRNQSSSLCCTQLHLLCVFMWWTPYHHNLWRRRSFKFLRWNDEIFSVCKEVPVIIIVSFALSGSVINTIPPGCEEDFCTRVWLTWGFLACEEVPAMISATCAQCGLVVHTYHNDTCRTFVPKSWLCFIYLDCVVQQSFALCSYCVVMWRTAHHRDRVALSKKFGNTWRYCRSPSASDHQCFLCVVWCRDEHFAAFLSKVVYSA